MIIIYHNHDVQDLDLARDEAPSVMVVDAGDVFVGGRYHSLVPILREVIIPYPVMR